MSKIFEKAKKYYENGLWTEKHLAALVSAGRLTQEEYDEIIAVSGREYPAGWQEVPNE